MIISGVSNRFQNRRDRAASNFFGDITQREKIQKQTCLYAFTRKNLNIYSFLQCRFYEKCNSSVPGESYQPKIIPHFAVYVKFSADNRQLPVLKVLRSLMLKDINFSRQRSISIKFSKNTCGGERFDMYYARLRANRRKINIYIRRNVILKPPLWTSFERKRCIILGSFVRFQCLRITSGGIAFFLSYTTYTDHSPLIVLFSQLLTSQ